LPARIQIQPAFSEQIPSQEILVENQSASQGKPRAAARFAGKWATTGKDRRIGDDRRALQERPGLQL
jgi:hypothetical protein